MVSLPLQGAIFFGTVLGLWVGARLLVDSAVRLARSVGLSELTIGLTIVALGTSMPELVVTTDAALNGLGDIAVGNIVGSNIYNLAFVLGVVSAVRFVPVERSLVRRDGVALLLATLLGVATLLDLTVTRVEGAVLVGSLVVYTAVLFRTSEDAASEPSEERATADASDAPAFRKQDGAMLAAGLAVVLVSGHFLVESASAIARVVGLSEWVIGETIVAAGTSTPEFAVSIVAIRRGSVGVSVGNVVGSDIFNLLGAMGLGALIRPLTVSATAVESTAWLVAVVVVVVAAMWSGRKVSRLEGVLLAVSEVVRWGLSLFDVFG
ncbi:cation:H+ antiporter [Halopelagius inordinatus]|uniref:Cation:H+ antiporter n=1 Tax=Halopelagius inordinatus TaxID=553467 RepID=A0A1I2PC94_9EURY|nr:calcium/sodium antiporter [Halopelagius inordinatus]SFG11071.1 cation:H+ antiporter [Halopelagius inordinatus]